VTADGFPCDRRFTGETVRLILLYERTPLIVMDNAADAEQVGPCCEFIRVHTLVTSRWGCRDDDHGGCGVCDSQNVNTRTRELIRRTIVR